MSCIGPSVVLCYPSVIDGYIVIDGCARPCATGMLFQCNEGGHTGIQVPGTAPNQGDELEMTGARIIRIARRRGVMYRCMRLSIVISSLGLALGIHLCLLCTFPKDNR